ncbi:hypothetical protein [Aeromonas caviae]|uniref:hypothetical protein n=1 Tax=Aeromonas caviae TaxID=648 RepID=UPI002254E2C9|nr:hypothetical protein [Aeromonas caviae]MCX4030883.1 hypothetical protein [Aeromonas caviae]MCX4071189.1 hypothetical protein [Aeromonas caviae]
MTHEAEQERMAAHRREWDKQSIYLRLQEGIPAAFWVWGDLVAPLEPCLTQGDQGTSFGWGEADEASLALSHAIIARLVSVGLVAPEQAGEKARYLRDEVLAKLPAGEHYDLHLSYLRLLLGDPPGSAA